jgi:hypothetical protein
MPVSGSNIMHGSTRRPRCHGLTVVQPGARSRGTTSVAKQRPRRFLTATDHHRFIRVFLAQQEVDYLRTLTSTELSAFPNVTRGESSDEMIDVNVDGTPDYRRIVVLTNLSPTYDLEVLVFPATEALTSAASLIANPQANRVRARINTVISR